MAGPVVDRIENDLRGKAKVVRLDVFDMVSGDLAEKYHVHTVPTVLVFNGKGKLVHSQVGIPDREHLLGLVRRL